MTHDLTTLRNLGDEYAQLDERLKEIRAQMRGEVIAAHDAGVQQKKIIEASRYTRETVRTILRKAGRDA